MSDPKGDIPRAPAGLGAAGRRLWRDIVNSWHLDARELQLLTEACRCFDHAAALDARVAADGPVVVGASERLVAHPGLHEGRMQRLAAGKLLGQLDLRDDEADGPQTASSQRARHAARTRWQRIRREREGGGPDLTVAR